jgi:hypothetical protein
MNPALGLAQNMNANNMRLKAKKRNGCNSPVYIRFIVNDNQQLTRMVANRDLRDLSHVKETTLVLGRAYVILPRSGMESA